MSSERTLIEIMKILLKDPSFRRISVRELKSTHQPGNYELVSAYLRKPKTNPNVKQAFINELNAFGGSVDRFAEYYGLKRATAYRYFKGLGIRPSDYR